MASSRSIPRIGKKIHPYTELKAKTHYSFLRGASSPGELITTAIESGLRGLALTDVGGVYGIAKAYQALREYHREHPEFDPQSFRLIIGSEVLFRPVQEGESVGIESVTLIAPTRQAYGALCRLLTESHRTQAKGTGSFVIEEFLQWMNVLPHANQLLIFPQWESAWLKARGLEENRDGGGDRNRGVNQALTQLSSLKNSFYFPISRHKDGLDQERTDFARKMSKQFQWPCVAHNSVLYHAQEAQILQDVLTSIHEKTPLKELGVKLRRNSESRLKTTEEMAALFQDFPEALWVTEEVRERCTFELSELRYRYPTEWIPEGHTAQSYLTEECWRGVKARYPQGMPEKVRAQLLFELQLIDELKFADYFLTVHDIVQFARREKILCQGRGSAANSVVCYLLGITAIDPVSMNMLFERFISAERGEPPDIDVDFEHDRREEVIQYIYQKYGRHRAAMVAAVVTYQPRSSLREVAKAFSVDVGTDSARVVEKKMREALSSDQASGQASGMSPKLHAKIFEVTERLRNFPRHLSIHSGGFTLSSDPIDTIVPIEPATMEGRTIIQWDKYDLDILGLLKIDVLALGMLSAIRRVLDYTGLELHTVPIEDKATYSMIQKADTIGVFQIESRAQMSMLPRLKPATFYDLVIEVALVRPGPIVGKMVHPYLQRRRALASRAVSAEERKTWLPDPRLEPILGRTHGVPIFQEQVMKMAVTLAGFSPGEADRLRRAIGAWRSSGSIDEMGQKLMNGLLREGIPLEFAERVFDQIQGFSEYGFPESHAASFALLTYVSSYLKCHHPAAFLYALLNSQPMGFYSPHSLIDDAKRHGVRVLAPCVSHSSWSCEMVDANSVRIGLRFVQGLEENEAQEMLKERAQGAFKNFQNFVARTSFNFRSLRSLAMASAFDGFGLSSREALFQVLAIQPGLFQQEEVQQDLFGPTSLKTMSLEDRVLQDYQSMSLSVRAHPTRFLREKLQHLPHAHMHSRWLRTQSRHRQMVRVMGLSVVLQRPPTAKGTAFATLEDEFGVIDLIFHREVFQRYKETIREDSFLWVVGEVQRDGDCVQIIVKRVEAIFGPTQDLKVPIAPGAHAKRR